jgi:hypothetical protein
MASVWIPIGACAWLGASLVVAVFMSKVAALVGPDSSTLMKRLPVGSARSAEELRARGWTTRGD